MIPLRTGTHIPVAAASGLWQVERMNHSELDQLLRASFDDLKLSQAENRELREVLDDVAENPDALRFVRNKAFDIAKDYIQDEEQLSVLRWVEKIMKAIDSERPTPAPGVNSIAAFSPGHDCLDRILAMIKLASQTIDVCVFTISDDRISNALIHAHEDGIRVRIISDDDKAHDRGSDIFRLSDAGIPLVTDRSTHHMHHKFAIFDNKLLLTGSFNWTRSATAHNRENVAITNDPTLLRAFTGEFNDLWNTLPKRH